VQPHARTKADAEFSAGNLGGFAPSDRGSGVPASPRRGPSGAVNFAVRWMFLMGPDRTKTRMQHQSTQHLNDYGDQDEILLCILPHRRLILPLQHSDREFSHGLGHFQNDGTHQSVSGWQPNPAARRIMATADCSASAERFDARL
jgi:hypothetical protein